MNPLLIDFDGVVRIGNLPAPGADTFLNFLLERKVPAMILSNSTLRRGEDIISFLRENGLPADIPAMTTIDSALQFLHYHRYTAQVYCNEEMQKYFSEFYSDTPDVVIVGDIGSRWNAEIMNHIFTLVLNGARLVALHKNKYWMPDGKTPVLDAGAYIAGIEYASGKEAELIGKPGKAYFQEALMRLGLARTTPFIMLGDDIATDIIPAKKIQGTGILILTGKTGKSDLETSVQKPDYVALNLNEVCDILQLIIGRS